MAYKCISSGATVSIAGTPNVAVTNTPNVSVTNTPSVTISGTPAVTISGTPTVSAAVTSTEPNSATFSVKTAASIDTNYAEVTGLGAADSTVDALVFEVHNPDTTNAVLVRINGGTPISIPASSSGLSVYTAPYIAGHTYVLGGASNEVEWKASAATISSPLFVLIESD